MQWGDTRYKYLEILYLLQMGIAINEKVTTHCSSTTRLLATTTHYCPLSLTATDRHKPKLLEKEFEGFEY